MKKVIFLFITVVLLVVFNVSLLYKNKQNEEKLQLSERKLELSTDARIDLYKLKESMIFQQMSEAVSCRDFELNSSKGNKTISFRDLMQGKKSLLFFRVKENDCDACIETVTRQLKEMEKILPEQGVIVLAGYKNVRQFYAFAQIYDGHFGVMNVSSLPVAAENQDQPYFFVVTPELKMQNVFIVNKGDSKLTEEYVHSMVHKYWGECQHDHEKLHI